jgi:solute carrier family 25 protein 42
VDIEPPCCFYCMLYAVSRTNYFELVGIFIPAFMTVLQFISGVFTIMDVSESAPISDKLSRGKTGHRLSHSQVLMSGALSGAMAKTVIAPLDRLKILFQTDPAKRFTISEVFKMAEYIRTNLGYVSFWRGHTATLVRVIPYSATNFFVFDRTRTNLEPIIGSGVHPVVLKFVCGALSGSAAVFATYPLETLRARLAVDIDGNRYPTGYIQAVKSIVKSEGLMSLYSGLRPTLVGIIPYAGTSFAVYETLKTDHMSFQSRFAVGALAGVLAQAITYPLDVVRRRMQVYPNNYSGIWTSLRRVATEEGLIRGLYKGLSMNIIKGPLAVAISLNANDHIKEFFLSRNP